MLDAREVNVDEIQTAPGALRECNQQTEEFRNMVDSVADKGILQPLTVRTVIDPETKQEYLELIDGLQRLTAAREAGLETVPCTVQNIKDDEVLLMQVVHNLQRIQTKPIEFSNALRAMLNADLSLKIGDLANKLNYSIGWIEKLLNLRKLTETATRLTQSGDISASNAIELTSLPEQYQDAELENAQTMTAPEFTSHVKNLKKEISKSKREGRDPEFGFEPVAALRKKSEIEAEMKTGEFASRMAATGDIKSVEDAILVGVAWCLKLDPEGKEEQIQAHKEKEEKAKRKREETKKQRIEKKAQRAELQKRRASLEAKLFEEGASEEDTKAALQKFDEENGLVKKSSD